jgi:activating signal cointegrator complex subunit 3
MVLDNCIRVLQGMVDLAADQGWLATALHVMLIVQMLIQARWHDDSSLLSLPHVSEVEVERLEQAVDATCLPELMELVNQQGGSRERVRKVLEESLSRAQAEQVVRAAASLPVLEVEHSIKGKDAKTGKLLVDEEYALEVKLTLVGGGGGNGGGGDRGGGGKGGGGGGGGGGGRGQYKASLFGRTVNEGYWLVLGEASTGDLIAMKRIGGIRGRSTRATLSFFTEQDPGQFVYTLYVMSDCYLGLDQQYDMHIDVEVGVGDAGAGDYDDDLDEYGRERGGDYVNEPAEDAGVGPGDGTSSGGVSYEYGL